jgi:hypothetical protein
MAEDGMELKDAVGYAVSGANARSLEALEQGAHELRCYIGDPVATVERALAESPELVLGHVLKAYLHLLGTEPGGLPVARAAAEAAEPLPANERERRHLEAIGHLNTGRWRAAARVLEDLTIEYPLDCLALQAGHVIDFFTGEARMLRDRISRALPHWSEAVPGYHAVLAMHAFGLEETGNYAAAEAEGRRSVELEPRDGWGQHAVAHVMEMQDRRRDGIAWMRANPDAWSYESFFAVHNWWHVALFHLGLDEVDEVLALYDGPVYGKASTMVLDMIDSSALLWRLELRGIDVGNRWEKLADNWEPLASARNYAFNDMHAMMAFVGAGRTRAAQAVLEAQREAMATEDDNASFTREVGHAATLAIKAFGEGDYAETVRQLRPVRSTAHRFGGSHAQRDLLDLTLIEAARRAGMDRLHAALSAERLYTRRDAVPFPSLRPKALATA